MGRRIKMIKFLRKEIGKGFRFEQVKEDIDNYIGEDEFLEVLEEVAQDGEIKGDVYEDFIILEENEERDSVEGFDPWFSLEIMIRNDKLNMIFVCEYGGSLDEFGLREYDIELMEDIDVYKITEEIESKLQEYQKQKDKEERIKKEQAKKDAEKFRKNLEEIKKQKNKVKQEKKKVRKELGNTLLEEGFDQCKSLKGNYISQFMINVFILDGKVSTSYNELIDEVEKIKGKTFTDWEKEVLYQRAKKDIRIKVKQDVELDVVKKYTSKEIRDIVRLYVHNINKEKGYKYYGAYNGYLYEEFEGSKLELVNLFQEVIQYLKKREEERIERFKNLMKDIGL